MPVVLLLAFIAVPLVEIGVFIEVGGWIGLWPTLAIVIVTAVAGTWLLRMQGLATLARAQGSLARQQFPVEEVFDGLCLLFAGALLLTPGFVTDTVGFLLFVPAIRHMLRQAIWRYLKSTGRVSLDLGGLGPDGGLGPGGDVVDGDYRDVTPEAPRDDDTRRIGDNTRDDK